MQSYQLIYARCALCGRVRRCLLNRQGRQPLSLKRRCVASSVSALLRSGKLQPRLPRCLLARKSVFASHQAPSSCSPEVRGRCRRGFPDLALPGFVYLACTWLCKRRIRWPSVTPLPPRVYPVCPACLNTILSYLEVAEVVTLSCASQSLLTATRSASVWTVLMRRDFPASRDLQEYQLRLQREQEQEDEKYDSALGGATTLTVAVEGGAAAGDSAPAVASAVVHDPDPPARALSSGTTVVVPTAVSAAALQTMYRLSFVTAATDRARVRGSLGSCGRECTSPLPCPIVRSAHPLSSLLPVSSPLLPLFRPHRRLRRVMPWSRFILSLALPLRL